MGASEGVKEDYVNSMTKLLMHSEKTKRILDVTNQIIPCDLTMPICIELHLTNVCNLKCEWCIDRKVRTDKAVLPLDTLIRLLDSIQGKEMDWV